MVRGAEPGLLELNTQSELISIDAGLRTWLLTLKTSISGSPVELSAVADSCEVYSPLEEVCVECLGQADTCTALYRIQEINPVSNLSSIPIKVKLVARYKPDVFNFYKLEDQLASLVGRNYLVHPKYALSLVLAYAREHNLQNENFVICDSYLEALLGLKLVKMRNLWTELCKLIEKVQPSMLYSTVNLEEFTQTTRSSQPVLVDESCNLFPEDWNLNSAEKYLIKTQTLPVGSATQTLPVRSAKSLQSSKRSLRRHKTI